MSEMKDGLKYYNLNAGCVATTEKRQPRLNEWDTNNWNSLDKLAVLALAIIVLAVGFSWAMH